MAQIIARIVIDLDDLTSETPDVTISDREITIAPVRETVAGPFSAEELRSADEAGSVMLQLIWRP